MNNRKPSLLILAGPNGSGKTTFASLLLQHEWGKNCLNLNADALARELGDWNNPTCVQQAQHMVREQLESALCARQNILYETVFSHPSKLELIRKARALGYFIRLFFICTASPRINIDRVAERFAKGGHTVPGDKVCARYTRALLYGAEAMRIVQRGYLYDNSHNVATCELPFRIIFRTTEDSGYKLYMPEHELPEPYAYFLKDYLAQE